MRHSKIFFCLSAFVLIFQVNGCKEEEVKPNVKLLNPIQLDIPSNFPQISENTSNPLTSEGVALGRLLFFDTRLSGNNSISCASCHRPELAFSDAVSRTNVGFTGIPLQRNSSALINLAWANNGLLWDGAAVSLESQATLPIADLHEMNQTLPSLEAELKQIPDYISRFRTVFNDEVKAELIGKALAQFQMTLISGNSKYDKFVRNENGIKFSQIEENGMRLFREKCGSCHTGDLFTDHDFHNNGIDASFDNPSFDRVFLGRYRVTLNMSDLGKFKTPTLRNIELTEPYMHDGRFITLERVLDHYSSGVQSSATLDPLLIQPNGRSGISLSDGEKTAIIAFLKTLSDYTFTANKNFSKP
ncbi:MAG: cytochrome-c peroxidase [Bacteroidia bacterium]